MFHSILGRQVVTIAAAIIPTLLFALLAILLYADAELRQRDQQRIVSVRALSEAIDRQIFVEQATLKALLASAAFEQGDWAALHDHAVRTIRGDPLRRVVLFNSQGGQIFHSLRPYGEALPAAAGLTPVVQALETGQLQVSDLVMGATVNEFVLGVYAPGRTASGVDVVLAMGFRPDLIQQIVDGQGLPERLLMSVVDREGRFIARIGSQTEPLERVIGRRANEVYLTQIKTVQHGAIETRSLEGRAMRGAFYRSLVTGWTVGVAAPSVDATEELRRSLIMLGAGGLTMLALAIGLAARIAGRTTREIVGLSDAAEALGDGGPLPPSSATLKEVKSVANAMAKAERILRERTRELNESETRYRLISENARDMILFADSDGVVRYLSPSSAALTGRAVEDCIGRSFLDLVAVEDRPGFERFLQELQSGLREAEFRHRICRSDGALIWVESAVRVVADAASPASLGFIAGVRDVSARKQAEDAALEALTLADASNRAKSQFLAGMSHELRTPLNAVIGFAQLLTYAKAENLTPKQIEYIEYIATAGNHLLVLVTDLLDLAKIEAGKLRISIEWVESDDVLAVLENLMRPIADAAQVSFTLQQQVSLAVRTDRSRLLQVLLNLCSNAIKYNWKGGSVSVTFTRLETGRVRFMVKDNGRGISPENQKTLFQPFQRGGSPEVDGNGIGLTISERLAVMMGGGIGFFSVLGEGSEFWLDLPVDGAALESAAD